MTNIKTPSDLVNRLRETASKGVSVWGDLQMEAAREIEILTAEREAYVSAMDRLQSAQPVTAAGEREAGFTTGHCKEHAKPGGCQLHNLQCGYPACDRRAV